MKYAFAAVFTPEANGAFSVRFPDLPGCYTCGDNMPDTVAMAQDALCLWLYDFEQDNKTVPTASNPKDIAIEGEEFTTIIVVDTEKYRRFYENKSVKKTLTIPMWLNLQAEDANINFSQLLQRALKEELKIAE